MLVIIFLQVALFFGLTHCSEGEGSSRKRKEMHREVFQQHSGFMLTAGEAGEVIEENSGDEENLAEMVLQHEIVNKQEQTKACHGGEISANGAVFSQELSNSRSKQWICNDCGEVFAQCYMWLHFNKKHSDYDFKAACSRCGFNFGSIAQYNDHKKRGKAILEQEQRIKYYDDNPADIPALQTLAAAAAGGVFEQKQEEKQRLEYLQESGKIKDLFLCVAAGCKFTSGNIANISGHRTTERRKKDKAHESQPNDFLKMVNNKYFTTEQTGIKSAHYSCVTCNHVCHSLLEVAKHVESSHECFKGLINLK